ncbi:HemX protein [Candidatus Magnetomoraceae bacterium gMMP-15]
MNFIFGLTVFFYILSTIWYVSYVFLQKDYLHKTAYYLLWAGFISHSLFFGLSYFRAGYIPVQNLHETLSITGWAIICVFLLFQFKFNLKVLGAFAAPFASLAVIAACLIPKKTIVPEEIYLFKSLWAVFHILIIFAGHGAFALAFALGCLYLIQENSIKSKKRGFFFKRLPSLDLLDNMGYACVAVGFPMLTIGIITGCIYAQIAWGRYWSWDPKEVWSIVTWLLYAALLHGRMAMGWRGRKFAVIAIIGFLVLLFTFFGVNFFLKGHHGVFTRW